MEVQCFASYFRDFGLEPWQGDSWWPYFLRNSSYESICICQLH